jgi:SMC interacting uncharacterized protein involved in chromosome segregation
MLSREEYEDNFKSELDEIKHQIEKLALTHRSEGRFLDLEEKEQKARLKLRELRSSSEDTWVNIRPELEKFYDDLNKSISSFH